MDERPIVFPNINLIATVLGLLLTSAPITYTPVVYAEVNPPQQQTILQETLQDKANRIALEVGISTSTLSNLITSESNWNPNATSSQGDRGIAQINSISHPEVSDQCAFDPDCAITWTANRIKTGHISEWVVANCYAYMRTLVRGLPKMAEIVPNGPAKVGSIAVFDYSGIKHIAYIKSFNGAILGVTEANYIPALIASRNVSIHDKHLIGFYTPPQGG